MVRAVQTNSVVSVTKLRQQVHVIIKFLTHDGVKQVEIVRSLIAQFGDQTLSRDLVFVWHKKVKEGRELVENEKDDRQPRINITNENIRKILDFLSAFEIAAQVGISYDTCLIITIKDSGFC